MVAGGPSKSMDAAPHSGHGLCNHGDPMPNRRPMAPKSWPRKPGARRHAHKQAGAASAVPRARRESLQPPEDVAVLYGWQR